jgi:serine/threonine protein kinase
MDILSSDNRVPFDDLVIFSSTNVVAPYTSQTLKPQEKLVSNRITYVVSSYLASGGLGAIYQGYEEGNSTHKVAIKEMITEIPDALIGDEHTARIFIEQYLWEGKPSNYVDAATFYKKLIGTLGFGDFATKYKEFIDIEFFKQYSILPENLNPAATINLGTNNYSDFIKLKAIEFIKTSQGRLAKEALDDARERFTREANILAQLRGANGVPQLVGVVRSSDYMKPYAEKFLVEYLIQDFIPGNTLRNELKLGTNNPQLWNQRTTLLFMNKVLGIVENFEKHQIVHKDLNPSNIIVDPNFFPWIIDYGIANDRSLSLNQASVFKNRAGSNAFGTSGYDSPEHRYRTTNRSDIYSLGVVLYEMLSGKNPKAPSFANLPHGDREDKIRQDLEIKDQYGYRAIQSDLAKIVLIATAEDPDKRYKSATEMRAAISNIKIETGLQKLARRKIWMIRGAAATLLLAGLLGGGYAVKEIGQNRKETIERNQIATATARAVSTATAYAQELFQQEIAFVKKPTQFNLESPLDYEAFRSKIVLLYMHSDLVEDYASYYTDYIEYTTYQNHRISNDQINKILKEYYEKVRNDPDRKQKSVNEIVKEFFSLIPVYEFDETLRKKCELMSAYEMQCQ